MFKRRLPYSTASNRPSSSVAWVLSVLYVLSLNPVNRGHAEVAPRNPVGGAAVEVESGSVELTVDGETRLVSVDAFHIQPRLVDNAEFQRHLDDIGAATRPAYWTYYSEVAEKPVVGVNLQDVLGFLEWLNAKGDGRIYRLPTEAEWRSARKLGRIEIQPGVGEFLLDYYSESWEGWPVEEGEPIRNPFGPILGAHGPDEARNFTGIRMTPDGKVERSPLAPDYTGLGFGFRLAWSSEGAGPLGERLILQAQFQMAEKMAEQPPGAVPPQPSRQEPIEQAAPARPAPIPTATNTSAPTATRTILPTPTNTTVPPSPTETSPPPTPTAAVAMSATPTLSPTPSPTIVPAAPPPAPQVSSGLPPFLLAGRTANTERFEARGCSLEIALPDEIKANEFTAFRLLAKNGFDEPKRLFLAISLEVETLAHIEKGPGFVVHPAGTALQSLQRPGARFGETTTQLPLLELADAEVAAGATRILQVPIRFSQPGQATLYVRATFLATSGEPRLDLNLPEMGFPDQLGFPSKAYEIRILPRQN